MKLLATLLAGVSAFLLMYHYSSKILDWLKFQSIGTRDYIVEKLSQMFVEIPPQRILMGLLAASSVPAIVVFLVCLPNVGLGVILGLFCFVIGWKGPKPLVDFLYKRRVNKLVLQMVDGLALMSNGLKSGMSVPQAMGMVVQEMPDPIREEFSLIMAKTRAGASLSQALTDFSKRVKSDDIQMFVTSVNILTETGGDLSQTFDTIVGTIRERVKVEGKIEALTAQGFYQGVIVAAVPPIMGLIFYNSDPEFMQPLFTTPLGWVILLVILILEVVGLFVIMKVVKIDV